MLFPLINFIDKSCLSYPPVGHIQCTSGKSSCCMQFLSFQFIFLPINLSHILRPPVLIKLILVKLSLLISISHNILKINLFTKKVAATLTVTATYIYIILLCFCHPVLSHNSHNQIYASVNSIS